MQRRDLLRLAAVGAGVVLVRPSLDMFDGYASVTPSRVGASDIEDLQQATRDLTALDIAQGGGAAGAIGAGLLRQADALLDAEVRPSWRPGLHHASAWLAEQVGFSAFDDGAHSHAEQSWRWALACLDEIDAPNREIETLRVRIWSSLALQQSWLANHDQAVTYANRAMNIATGDGLGPKAASLAWTTKARVSGRAGLVDETLAAIDEADEAWFTDPNDGAEWLQYRRDPTRMSDLGRAYSDLVLAGYPNFAGLAGARLAGARAGLAAPEGATYVRPKAFAGVVAATVAMGAGDHQGGVDLAHEVLPAAGQLRSQRVRGLLADLRHAGARHVDQPDVADLDHELAQLLTT